MMVNRAVCEDCENQVDYIVRDGPIYCECGQEMEFYGKVGSVTGVGGNHLRLTEQQRERFDRIKAECKDPALPEPTDKQTLDGLLDTWDAVDDDLYAVQQEETDA